MTKRVLPILITLFVVFLAGGARGGPADGYTNVDAATVQALLDRGVAVIDIRTPQEWRDTGTIPGSHRIMAFTPERQVNPAFLTDLQAVAKPQDEVVVVCRTGSRSRVISEALVKQAGYQHVYNAEHGMSEWLGQHRPVEPCPNC